MASTLDFYFEFSSPYSYLGSTHVEALAAETGLTLKWHPILMGPMFKAVGSMPLTEIPLKGDYAFLDFKRSALLAGMPYTQPDPFPIATVAAARATLYVREHQPDHTGRLVKALYHAYFVDGRPINQADTVLDVAAEVGLDRNEVAAGIAAEPIKAALKREVDDALGRGVFGAPFILIGNEPFWGFDRFDHVRQWVALEGERS